MANDPTAGAAGFPTIQPLPEPWNTAHQTARDLLLTFGSAVWEASYFVGQRPPDPLPIPPGQRDGPAGELQPTRYGALGYLAELCIRSDDSDPEAILLSSACPRLAVSRARRGEEPVRVGPVTAKSVAEGVLTVSRWLTTSLESAFGCGPFLQIVRASFPRDVVADPWEIDMAVGWYEATRDSPAAADDIANLLSARTEFLGRLYTWPLRQALDGIRLEDLCRWLHEQFAGLNVTWLREQLELEFLRAAHEFAGHPRPTPDPRGGAADSEPLAAPPRTNLFVRLSAKRYRIRYRDKEETVPTRAGLQLVEYLLKQPGKPTHVLEINRALCEGRPRLAAIEDAFARSGEQQGLDGFTADAWQSPDPCSEEDLEEAKEAVKSLEEQAARAWDVGEHDKAEELDRKVETGRRLVREQETLAARKRRGQPDHDSAVEKVRKNQTNNFRNAITELRTKYGLQELADHLEQQIDSGTEWTYRPAPGVEWAFDPESPLNSL
jgi:hypothetical protein